MQANSARVRALAFACAHGPGDTTVMTTRPADARGAMQDTGGEQAGAADSKAQVWLTAYAHRSVRTEALLFT